MRSGCLLSTLGRESGDEHHPAAIQQPELPRKRRRMTVERGPFEVALRPIGRGRGPWLPIAAVLAAALTVLVVAILPGGPPRGPDSQRSAVTSLASTSAVAGRIPTDAPSAEPAHIARPLPTTITCEHLDRVECRIAAGAAVATLAGDLPAVRSAEVSSNLICSDTIDCPTTRLDASTTPLAGVILRLVDGGPAAWINVVYRSRGRPLDGNATLEAWIARWRTAP
jgi:hypothetical protein